MSKEEVTDPTNHFVSIVATYGKPTMRITCAYHWYDATQIVIVPKDNLYQLTFSTESGDIVVMTEKFEGRFMAKDEGVIRVKMTSNTSDNVADDWLMVIAEIAPNGLTSGESVQAFSNVMTLSLTSSGFLLMDIAKAVDICYPAIIEGN